MDFQTAHAVYFNHNNNYYYLPTWSNFKHRKHVSEFWCMMRLSAFSWRRGKNKFLSGVYHAPLLDTYAGGQRPCQERFYLLTWKRFTKHKQVVPLFSASWKDKLSLKKIAFLIARPSYQTSRIVLNQTVTEKASETSSKAVN